MLPETLHWREQEVYFRDRGYKRSLASEFYRSPYAHKMSGEGGGNNGVIGIDGCGPRWRERHLNSEVYPYPYHHPSLRWVSDFRCRTGLPDRHECYAMQGSPHLYPEDGGHRFVQSHPNDRFLEVERYRSSTSGRHTRVNWKSRPSFNLKDKKGSLGKAALPHNVPGKLNDVGDKWKSDDDVLNHNSNSHSTFSYSCDLSQPKDQTEEKHSPDASFSPRLELRSCITGHLSSSRSTGLDCNEMKVEAQGNDTLLPLSGDADNPVAATYAPDDVLTHNTNSHSTFSYPCDHSQPKDQTEEKDSLDVSVTPRLEPKSCIMGHSSSSRSIGLDCNVMKVEAQQGNDTLLPPSGDADAYSPVAATYVPAASKTYTAPSEEIHSCKRRRLGWGEGLAKYESKKIEHNDDYMAKNDMVVCSNSGEQMHVFASDVFGKITGASSLTECPSPARQFALCYSYSTVTKEKQLMSGSIIPDKTNLTVSSATKEKQLMTAGSLDHDKSNLSLPPAIEEKQLMTARSIDHGKANLSLSPVAEEQQLKTDGSINHDKANLSVTSCFMPQYHVEGSNFKLGNLDLEPLPINDLPQSDSLSVVDFDFPKSTSTDELPSWKNDILKAIELTESEINKLECQLKSMSVPEIVHNQPTSLSFLPVDCLSKPSHIQTTGSNITCQTASVEVGLDKNMPRAADVNYGDVDLFSGNCAPSYLENQVQRPLTTEDFGYACLDANSNFEGLSKDKAAEFSVFNGSQSNDVNPLSDEEDEDNLCEIILESNRDSAIGAAEAFNKLLPANNCNSYIPLAVDNSVMIKARLLRRKLLLRFKERIVALKFRVFQHFWKQDVRLLSMRRFLVKSQTRTNRSLLPVHSAFNKYRLSLRSRVAGLTSLIADTEMINFAGKLISNNLVKPLRKGLKMPALIFDEKEKVVSRFFSSNGLVEDPMAVEKERSLLNPWTEEEKAIFMDKLSTSGKDFMKIASFLDHKTTADCIKFYYKNHKFEWFKGPVKEKDSSTNNYLIASEKQLMHVGNTASLDILGSATVTTIADNDIEIQQQCTSNYFLATTVCKILRDSCGLQERSHSPDLDNIEKETLAADVLSGTCSSLSITGAIDLGEAYCEQKCQEKCSSSRFPSTTEVSQCFDVETCSGESLEDMDDDDWTDAEKSIFIQGVSSYGKDFCMISRYMKTRSMDQCRLFFSKARKHASLDTICPGSGNTISSDANAACIDTNDSFAVANLLDFNVKSGIKTEGCLLSPHMILSPECDAAPLLNARPVLNSSEQSVGTSDLEPVDSEYHLDNLTEIQQVNENSEKDFVDHDTNVNQQVEKPEQALGIDGMGNGSDNMDLQCESTLVIHSDLGAVDTIRNADHPSDQSDCESFERPSSHLTGRELDLSEADVKEDSKKDNIDAVDESSSDHHMELNAQVDDVASTSGCDDTAGSLLVELCLDSLEESCVISLKRNTPIPMKLDHGVLDAAKCMKTSQEGTSSLAIDVKKNYDQVQMSMPGELYPSGYSLIDDSAACPQIAEGHAVSAYTAREVNDDTSSKKLVTAPSISRYNRNFQLPPGGGFLKKCNGTKKKCYMSEIPFKCVEKSRNCNPCSQSDATLGKDKPHQSRKLKLIGQVLKKPYMQQKRSVSVPQHEKLSSFASCDVSRIQTGFPSLAGSVIPYSRYHQALGTSLSSQMEHPRFHNINAGNQNLDGLSRFSARKLCSSSNRVGLEHQPEVLFPKMMRNGLEVVSGIQNAERGTVGIRCRGNSSVLVRGERSVFSDPLASRKRHYMMLPNHSALSDQELHHMQPKHSAFTDSVSAMNMHYMQPKHYFSGPVAGTRMLYMQSRHPAFPDPLAAVKMQFMLRKQLYEQRWSMIRGDDFWMGQGKHRQVELRKGFLLGWPPLVAV